MSIRASNSEKRATEAAREEVLPSPHQTATLPNPLLEKCAHELFEAQVARSPDAIAVVCKKQALTYGQLNTLADRFASRLKQAGVAPDVLVGLCVEPSLELAIGLLGILKAGGAYLPLDPLYPTERLDIMLNDAKPRVIVAQRHLAGRFSNFSAPLIVFENGAASAGINGASYEETTPYR